MAPCTTNETCTLRKEEVQSPTLGSKVKEKQDTSQHPKQGTTRIDEIEETVAQMRQEISFLLRIDSQVENMTKKRIETYSQVIRLSYSVKKLLNEKQELEEKLLKEKGNSLKKMKNPTPTSKRKYTKLKENIYKYLFTFLVICTALATEELSLPFYSHFKLFTSETISLFLTSLEDCIGCGTIFCYNKTLIDIVNKIIKNSGFQMYKNETIERFAKIMARKYISKISNLTDESIEELAKMIVCQRFPILHDNYDEKTNVESDIVLEKLTADVAIHKSSVFYSYVEKKNLETKDDGVISALKILETNNQNSSNETVGKTTIVSDKKLKITKTVGDTSSFKIRFFWN